MSTTKAAVALEEQPTLQTSRRSDERLWIVIALLSLYLIWGSTYLLMRIALGFLPPLLMGGVRFATAGALLFVFLRLRGEPAPTRQGWASALLLGCLFLVCGNGFVAFAERSVDSGVAATVVATMPLWTAAIGVPFGERPTRLEWLGLALGFAGVLVLNRGGGLAAHGLDAVLLLISPIAWALGSVLSRRLPVPSGMMGAASEMLAAGLVMLAFSAWQADRPLAPLTVSNVAVMAYLICFGSIIAFSAYGFLLRTTRASIATSYAYVNPMVALGLGTLWGGEAFTGAKLVACLLTVLGVLLVTLARAARVPQAR